MRTIPLSDKAVHERITGILEAAVPRGKRLQETVYEALGDLTQPNAPMPKEIPAQNIKYDVEAVVSALNEIHDVMDGNITVS